MDENNHDVACVHCGSLVPGSATVCPQCGMNPATKEQDPPHGTSAEFTCSDCGGNVAPTDTVCPHCGAKLDWKDASAPPGGPPESPSIAIVPMTLGDIFDKTFKLLGKTFTRSILVILIMMVPASALVIEGFRGFYQAIGDLVPDGDTVNRAAEGWTMFRGGMVFGFAVLMAMLAAMAAELGVTLLVCGEFSGNRPTWKGALGDALGIRLLRSLGVAILQGLAVSGIFVFVVMTVILSPWLLVLFIPAAVVLVVFLLIRWAFAFTAVACENAGVAGAFSRSWLLVRDQWWRVMGILFLLNLLLGFAVALVTTPISLVAMWDFYREYFKALGSAGSGQPDPRMMLHSMRSMGFGAGLGFSLNLVLQALVKPVYTTVLYFDLRARNREFETAAPSLLFDNTGVPPGTPGDGSTHAG